MNLPFIVNEMLQHLSRNGFTAYIAGGAARDIFHGNVPNDWDIVVVNKGRLDERDVFHALEDICRYFRSQFPAGASTSVTQAYDTASGDFDSRWLGLGQVEFSSSLPGESASMDILFSREPRIDMVLQGFDSNVNQAYIAGGAVVYPFGIPDELRILKPVTVARFQRLLQIAVETRTIINPTGLELID